MTEILRFIVVLSIAIPFLYMIFDVTLDMVKRCVEFYNLKVKPLPIKVRNRFDR